MAAEQTIAEIAWVERIFAAPDNRLPSPIDLAPANRRHDEILAQSPWFRLWQRYGFSCQGEAEGRLRIQSYCRLAVECQYQQVTSHTNPSVPTTAYRRGIASKSIDGGRRGIPRQCRRCSTHCRNYKTSGHPCGVTSRRAGTECEDRKGRGFSLVRARDQ